MAFVADAPTANVTLVDLVTGAVAGMAAVGANPVALAADNTRAYSADFGADTLTVIDVATASVEATVPVGGMPSGVAADPAGARVWVANLFDDTVSAVNPATATVVATIPVGDKPSGIAFDATGGRVYVANTADGTITAIDAATDAVLQTAPSGGLNPVAVVVSPAGDRIYVLHLAAGGVTALDSSTLAVVDTLPLAAGHLALAGFAAAVPVAPAALGIPTLGEWGVVALIAALAGLSLRTLRRGGSRSSAIALAALTTLATAAVAEPAGPFQIMDGSFPVSDWEIVADTGGGTVDATQQATGGNPGAYRRMQHFGEVIETFHRYIGTGATYSPATDGAVTAIDVAWDRVIVARDGGPLAFDEALLVFQNEQIFQGPVDTFQPGSLGVWQSTASLGLLATDFDDGSGGNPDFTASGAPLTFGYFRRTGAAGISGFMGHGIDNFQLTVTGGGVGGNAGTLVFEFPSYIGIDGTGTPISIERIGGTDGDVSANVAIPLGNGAVVFDAVDWLDGQGGLRTIEASAGGFLPPTGGIGLSTLTLVAPTGGVAVDPIRGKTLLMVAPADGGSLETLFLLLLILLSASGPWLAIPLVAAALYALFRRRSSKTAAAAPPSAP